MIYDRNEPSTVDGDIHHISRISRRSSPTWPPPAKSCFASGRKFAGIWKSPNRRPPSPRCCSDHLPLDRLTIHRFEPEHRRVRLVATFPENDVGRRARRHSLSATKHRKQLERWIRRREADPSERRTGAKPKRFSRSLGMADRGGDALLAPLVGEHGSSGILVGRYARKAADSRARKPTCSRASPSRSPRRSTTTPDCTRSPHCAKRPRPTAARFSIGFGRKDVGDTIVGEDSGLRQVMQRVDMVSRSDVPVLILGETGTGKELVARAIHNRSDRHSGPFIRVNCGAIPRELIDSQLFGHEKGSFTGAADTRQGWFERADMGTLFLDEIGELPLDAQVRFLRVLQDGFVERVGSADPIRVNVRVVAATHRDLASMVRESTFREDLWYRIAVFPILLPPLRERPEDIPAMARHFAERAAVRFGLAPVDAERGRHPTCCRRTIGPATSASWAP